MTGRLSHDRLRSKCDAHAGNAQHRQIVRAVAHCNYLLERDILLTRNLLE